MKKSIVSKLAFVFLFCGLLPFLAFGFYSIQQFKEVHHQTILNSNAKILSEVQANVLAFFTESGMVLHSLDSVLGDTQVSPDQFRTILINQVTTFPRYEQLALLNLENQKIVASSEIHQSLAQSIENTKDLPWIDVDGTLFRFVPSDQLIPNLLVMVKCQAHALEGFALIGELNLMSLWNYIDGISFGNGGNLGLVDRQGQILAASSGMAKTTTSLPVHLKKSAESSEFQREFLGEEHLFNVLEFPGEIPWMLVAFQPVQQAFSLSNTLSIQLIFMILVMVILSVIASLYFGFRYVGNPIQVIMDRLRSISKGDLFPQNLIQSQDELGQIELGLNRMVTDLKSLQEANLKKEKMALMGTLAAQLVHDIKQPFQSIQNHSRLMPHKMTDPDYLKEASEIIENECLKIDRFLMGLRDLSQDLPFFPIKILAETVVEDVLRSFGPQLREQEISLKREIQQDLYIDVDVFSFQRLLGNLVKNAIEAMPSGGTLKVMVSKGMNEGDKIQIAVSDTGIGIPDSIRNDLFTDFKTTKSNGLGLGLAIVKKIIAQHSGELKVESEVGKGSSFSVFLPTAV